MTLSQPMLAASLLKADQEHSDDVIIEAMRKRKYPVMATLKKDGIRTLRVDTNYALASRTLKPIPNNFIRQRAQLLPVGFDMELWNPELDYNTIQSIVMSEGHPQSDLIEFHVLDDFSNETYYEARLQSIARSSLNDLYEFEPPSWHSNAESLFTRFKDIEEKQGEGICFRVPSGPYKEGRSTLKEQYLVKFCRMMTQECTIVGFKEQMHNGNDEQYNEVGKMKRSSQLAFMEPKNTLGAFIVRNEHGLTFPVGNGVGLTEQLRKEIWLNQDKWLDKEIVVRSKAHGVKVKPRSPVYWGMREKGY